VPLSRGSFGSVQERLDNVADVSSTPRSVPLRPRRSNPVRLGDLFGLRARHGSDQTSVRGITVDSRLVAVGDLYVALPGQLHHGAEFAAAAADAGAVAVLTDRAGADLVPDLGRPVVVVTDPRRAMAAAAARIYGDPSEAMTMFAITGTNGKTTTSFLLDSALRAAGHRTGVIGTLGFLLSGTPLDTARTTVTTPESTELQALLAVMKEDGADSVVMEVSSHALVLGRADAIVFDVAAFTNFGRDHLDFHGDEESYFAAKSLLFTAERTRHAVVNIDDPRGQQLVRRIRADGRIAVSTLSLTAAADYTASRITIADDGRTTVVAQLPHQTLEFTVGLPGEFNVRNALTALAMLDRAMLDRAGPDRSGPDRAGLDLSTAIGGLATAAVPGRMQPVELGPGAPGVYVDFAHTPQAVAAALRALAGRRRIVVLGCGGDRDPEKRAPMGAAAAREADVVIVTDDNPRTEPPESIRAQVLSGAQQARDREGLLVDVVDGGDRRSAIRLALQCATAGEVIAVLGKGHEVGQEINARQVPFSDAHVVTEEWGRLHPAASPRTPGSPPAPVARGQR
jgi:UDP-N-acetylmuramoyl-L-alanyl-D-glutamate--2,6-diaminopimelate ligase